MKKFISLLVAAHVAGQLRHPHEGVLHVDDADAERLIAAEAAVDVTDDFAAKANRETPVEPIAEGGGQAAAPASENPHQSDVAPAAADAPKPRRRSAASQE